MLVWFLQINKKLFSHKKVTDGPKNSPISEFKGNSAIFTIKKCANLFSIPVHHHTYAKINRRIFFTTVTNTDILKGITNENQV